jgi:hypothetical protein
VSNRPYTLAGLGPVSLQELRELATAEGVSTLATAIDTYWSIVTERDWFARPNTWNFVPFILTAQDNPALHLRCDGNCTKVYGFSMTNSPVVTKSSIFLFDAQKRTVFSLLSQNVFQLYGPPWILGLEQESRGLNKQQWSFTSDGEIRYNPSSLSELTKLPLVLARRKNMTVSLRRAKGVAKERWLLQQLPATPKYDRAALEVLSAYRERLPNPECPWPKYVIRLGRNRAFCLDLGSHGILCLAKWHPNVQTQTFQLLHGRTLLMESGGSPICRWPRPFGSDNAGTCHFKTPPRDDLRERQRRETISLFPRRSFALCAEPARTLALRTSPSES